MPFADEDGLSSAVGLQHSPALHRFESVFAADPLQAAQGIGVWQRLGVLENTVCNAELVIATHALAAQFDAFILLIVQCLSAWQGGLYLLPSWLLFEPLLQAFIHDSLGRG